MRKKTLDTNPAANSAARALYEAGRSNKQIAGVVGCSPKSVQRAAKEDGWDEQMAKVRAAAAVSNASICDNILRIIDAVTAQSLESDEPLSPADVAKLLKLSTIYEKLKEENNVKDVINVFTALERWMVQNKGEVPCVTDQFIDNTLTVHNAYIKEKINSG